MKMEFITMEGVMFKDVNNQRTFSTITGSVYDVKVNIGSMRFELLTGCFTFYEFVVQHPTDFSTMFLRSLPFVQPHKDVEISYNKLVQNGIDIEMESMDKLPRLKVFKGGVIFEADRMRHLRKNALAYNIKCEIESKRVK